MKKIIKVIIISFILFMVCEISIASVVAPEEVMVSKDDPSTVIHFIIDNVITWAIFIFIGAGITSMVVFFYAISNMIKIKNSIKKEENEENIESMKKDCKILKARICLFVFLSIAFLIAGGMLNIVAGFKM